MPYANIHYIKLQKELLNDKRFIFDCDDHQKWLFVGLLLLAGDTKNDISSDVLFLKNRLNINLEVNLVKKNLEHLLELFPKMICSNGRIKFKKFNELHNYLDGGKRKSKGNPKELQRVMQSIVDKIIENKSIDKKNPTLVSFAYKRYGKSAKELALLSGLDPGLACRAIDWVAGWCRDKGYTWELETVVKHFISGKAVDFKKSKGLEPVGSYKTL